MNIKEIKLKARESLVGKYGDAIGVMMLLSIASLIGSELVNLFNFSDNVTIILTYVVDLIITGLLGFGSLSFYLKLSRDENVEIDELWSKTNMAKTYILASVVIAIFTSLWTLLLIIPGIIASFSYSMTHYILLDNPSMSVMEALKESKRIMTGHKMDLFLLNLSFIGWIILGIFTFGILYFWLMPYMSVTTCNFYNQIKNKEI